MFTFQWNKYTEIAWFVFLYISKMSYFRSKRCSSLHIQYATFFNEHLCMTVTGCTAKIEHKILNSREQYIKENVFKWYKSYLNCMNSMVMKKYPNTQRVRTYSTILDLHSLCADCNINIKQTTKISGLKYV